MSEARAGWGTAVAGVAAAMTLVLLTCACCLGVYLVIWPVNYLGCGTHRPDGITTADLAGTYRTNDGGRLVLYLNGTLTTVGVSDNDMPPDPGEPVRTLSGPGTWQLQPAEHSLGSDIKVSFSDTESGGLSAWLDISGSRDEPWLFWCIGDPDSCDLYRFTRI